MFRNTGNFTFATIDYYYENVFGRLDDENMPKMTKLIDPYEYRERLVMPKMIISSSGDEFFMPDDTHYFFQDLPEPKYFRILPNAEHSTVLSGVSNPHFIFSMRSLFIATIKGLSVDCKYIDLTLLICNILYA